MQLKTAPHITVLLLLCAAASGCSMNLKEFGVLQKTQPGPQSGVRVARAEAAAQGAGIASSGNYRVRGVTLGGTFLRRKTYTTNADTSIPKHLVTGGIHTGANRKQ